MPWRSPSRPRSECSVVPAARRTTHQSGDSAIEAFRAASGTWDIGLRDDCQPPRAAAYSRSRPGAVACERKFRINPPTWVGPTQLNGVGLRRLRWRELATKFCYTRSVLGYLTSAATDLLQILECECMILIERSAHLVAKDSRNALAER